MAKLAQSWSGRRQFYTKNMGKQRHCSAAEWDFPQSRRRQVTSSAFVKRVREVAGGEIRFFF